MKITGKTLLHLNKTCYFDEDGDLCDSLKEARSQSMDWNDIYTVRKQNCYMKEWTEMSDWEKEQAESNTTHWDYNVNPNDYIYVFGAAKDNLLFFNDWIEFRKQLNDGTFTVVEKKRN